MDLRDNDLTVNKTEFLKVIRKVKYFKFGELIDEYDMDVDYEYGRIRSDDSYSE